MPTVEQLLTYLFYAIISTLAFLLWNVTKALVAGVINYFKSFLEELKKLRSEIAELNGKITEIISNQGWMEKSIEKHDGLFKDVFDRLNSLDKTMAAKGKTIGH